MDAWTALQQMGVSALLSLIVAVLPAIVATAYALWPTESKLMLMRPVTLAGLFGAAAGFVIGVINMLQWLATHEMAVGSPTALIGLSESLVPPAVAFGSLTIAWLLVAIGMRRAG